MRPTRETLDTSRDIVWRTWDLDALFALLSPTGLHLTPEERQNYEPIFWHSVCTEFDSRNFFNYLIDLPQKWSEDFLQFVHYWLRDESRHTEGFARIYSMIYNENIESIYKRLHERPVDFSNIDRFFTDELSICLLLAYDEIVTTHVYHRSTDFYEKINKPVLGQWIRLLKSDEALHFGNLIHVIKRNHGYCYQKAATVLADILEVEHSLSSYGSTFVLDHDCPDFSLTDAELDSLCIQVILSKLQTHHHQRN